ncbi:hypothetical protein [Streptomyces antarcticus]|uniref:hypothetical protein n=1 Tax=Streptomyces antarcticus TaxID=2996458 RepID=UPI002271A96F|nr:MULTISPECIES: hypothetical protein [unclassified Streptomyces]MCY0944109.1 hypothetical protein [Streptomyces sp. H34-AA3]MCZ4087650.1 hypothetical protein [Streptomyces sp. H34-S5]
MPLNLRRVTIGGLGLLTVLVPALTAVLFHQGRTPGLYPERSWGPWKDETMDVWSTHVRINSWTHAAQARINYGKAEEIHLGAYGEAARETSGMFRTRFTLTPDGGLTAKQQ